MASAKARLLRWTIKLHRWSGLILSLLFLLWFASGVVMMFKGYPRLTDAERIELLRPLPASALAVPPAGDDWRLNRPGERPLYHRREDSRWYSVYADTGEPYPGLDADAARLRAEALTGQPVRAVTRQAAPDQWSLSSSLDPYRPLFRVRLDDAAATDLYISSLTGEVVRRTTFEARLWGYAGPVIHWIYPTQLRRLGGVWRQVVMWLAGFGAVSCLLGLVLGVWVLRIGRRGSLSPYRGWRYWHHWAGLVFGVFALTWVFSGLLSLDPFFWAPSTRSGPQLEARLAGQVLDMAPTPEVTAVDFPVKEIRPRAVGGETLLSITGNDGRTRLVGGDGTAVPALSAERLRRLAAGLVPDASLSGFRRLTDYDTYYYAGRGTRVRGEAPPLPVYRARYDDRAGTMVYLDAASGRIVHVSRDLSRLRRWLYHGLHSLDFPALASGSVAWYALVLVLMAGGTALSFTGVWLTVRWLRRSAAPANGGLR